jgi:cytidylate kinase
MSTVAKQPTLSRLVEKQMLNWEIARRQSRGGPDGGEADVYDFVAVSRAVGAGGHELAAKLGESLGWPAFDKEILDAMAGDDALRRRIYESMDERDMDWCEETLKSLLQPGFSRNDYFHRLTETVLSLARQGSAVFLGRGAHLILPRDRGFRVRLVAPVGLRVTNLARARDLPMPEARAEMARIEESRAAFLANHFRVPTDDATLHDLTINMERFSLEEGVALILSTRQRLASQA